jgi:hypothetical protein
MGRVIRYHPAGRSTQSPSRSGSHGRAPLVTFASSSKSQAMNSLRPASRIGQRNELVICSSEEIAFDPEVAEREKLLENSIAVLGLFKQGSKSNPNGGQCRLSFCCEREVRRWIVSMGRLHS